MSGPLRIYGDAPAGDHAAILQGVDDVRFSSGGMRTIVSFLVLNEAGNAPMENICGEPYFAVAVCNTAQGISPKSKVFKIRKAMLGAGEFDPIRCATEVPDWGHFKEPLPDGNRRRVNVRVVEKRTTNGGSVSEIVAIQRPRDGVWESIEGKFAGPPFQWLTMDGRRIELPAEKYISLPAEQKSLYENWLCIPSRAAPWRTADGGFRALSEAAVIELRANEKIEYEIAQLRTQRRWAY